MSDHEDLLNAVTQITEVSIDWRSLNGGEIGGCDM